MRKAFILAAVLLQVFVLAFMAGEREYILANGEIIHLRTAPIDPRDLFRGDYVRLNYEISRVTVGDVTDAADVKKLKKGEKVYVLLREGPNGLYEYVDARLEEPKEGVFLTGRTTYPHRRLVRGAPIWLKYGIEAFFVEQGKGRAIEKRRGNRSGVQVPLEMAIALGGNGKAVIKEYRWSPLGIGLQILRSAARTPQRSEAPTSATVRVQLSNASDQPLAIVNLPDYCSFSLEPVPWSKERWTLAYNSCEAVFPTDSHVVTLAPNETVTVDLDFSDVRWFVRADDTVSQIGTLEWSEQFRVVYRPPNEKDCRHLEQRDQIWHGHMPSRVFHGRGQID